MTDEQIIKALECCTIDGEKDCFNCAETNWMSCKTTLMKQALDLINRQKVEIEKLKEELADARYLNTVAADDAIKEFAERLKKEKMDGGLDWGEIVDVKDIDNLVKEMTEGGRDFDDKLRTN